MSKFSTRLSDHLNLVFECVSAAASYSLVLTCHFGFHRTFLHSNFVILLLFFINLRMHWLIVRPGWMITGDNLARLTKLARFSKTLAWQNEPARFQLPSCNGEAISEELITDCRVGFKMMQNSVPSYKRASSPQIVTP